MNSKLSNDQLSHLSTALLGTGFLLINKPAGITSFDCIRRIKTLLRPRYARTLRQGSQPAPSEATAGTAELKASLSGHPEEERSDVSRDEGQALLPKQLKIGHTGTLDDFATGLLIICIGRQATRMSSALMGMSKEYVFTAKLGELTDSLDLTGNILETVEDIKVTRQQLVDAIQSLCPSYDQIPPIYSALKHEGQPLYHLARRGLKSSEELEKIVAQKGRTVTISDFQLLDFNPPFFTVRMTVSKGAYVRSLANDIAQKLGLPATTYKLERTMINTLSLHQAQKLDIFRSIDDVEKHLMTLEELQGWLKQNQ